MAWSKSGPSVLLSVAFPATLYQPFAISVTAPLGDANDPPFLLIVTVGEAPVSAVMWSADSTRKKTNA